MALPTITEYYESDHDRLDELFRKFQEVKRSDLPKAKEFFLKFKEGLQRHIIWEEELLFPLFERKTGMTSGGPTQVMRMEHVIIKQHLEQIHELVKLGSPDTDESDRKLLETLSAHNMKEEQILYPAIDRTFEGDEAARVFKSMERLPAERYNK